jgi:hypothetical protein
LHYSRDLGKITHENDEYTAVTAQKKNSNTLVDSVLNQINKRMGDIDTNHLLRDMQYLVNLPTTDAELAVYGEGQLKALCDFYSEVLN